ncbi:eukaryotic translation initiation factor 4B-like protein [Cricetulus griseus]|nr:eukaryotic translation initiation factor 4B-like protein [Cricetulus griseus]
MAASAKKKNKGKTISLTDFLAEDGGTGGGSTYVPKPVSWADETEDLEGDVSTTWHSKDHDVYRAPPIDRSILPTAPAAAREPNIYWSHLPKSPPYYTAFLGNLPYDVTEYSIKEFFRGLIISTVRLPREPSNPDRLKGFGYAEFEDLDSLLSALSLNEESLDYSFDDYPPGRGDDSFGDKYEDRYDSDRYRDRTVIFATELESSARAANAFNFWDISPVPGKRILPRIIYIRFSPKGHSFGDNEDRVWFLTECQRSRYSATANGSCHYQAFLHFPVELAGVLEVGRETYGRKIPDYTDVLSRQLIPTDKTAAEEKVRTKYLEEIDQNLFQVDGYLFIYHDSPPPCGTVPGGNIGEQLVKGRRKKLVKFTRQAEAVTRLTESFLKDTKAIGDICWRRGLICWSDGKLGKEHQGHNFYESSTKLWTVNN